MLANCWGAVIGAKVVKYRTAVLLGIICELVGVLVFGPRVAVVYNGILNDWTVLKPYPGLALYALMWAEMTLVTWQFLAIWKQILVPVYLGFGTCFYPLLPPSALSRPWQTLPHQWHTYIAAACILSDSQANLAISTAPNTRYCTKTMPRAIHCKPWLFL